MYKSNTNLGENTLAVKFYSTTLYSLSLTILADSRKDSLGSGGGKY